MYLDWVYVVCMHERYCFIYASLLVLYVLKPHPTSYGMCCCCSYKYPLVVLVIGPFLVAWSGLATYFSYLWYLCYSRILCGPALLLYIYMMMLMYGWCMFIFTLSFYFIIRIVYAWWSVYVYDYLCTYGSQF